VLDRALEIEFRKTLEVFDVFVESVGQVDTRKLKAKMIMEHAPLTNIELAATPERFHEELAMEEQLPGFRETVLRQISNVKRDLKEQDEPSKMMEKLGRERGLQE
jgi:hypothetical protein